MSTPKLSDAVWATVCHAASFQHHHDRGRQASWFSQLKQQGNLLNMMDLCHCMLLQDLDATVTHVCPSVLQSMWQACLLSVAE